MIDSFGSVSLSESRKCLTWAIHGNSNGENDDCPSNLGVPYLPHKATFMHLSCVFFDSPSRVVWVMNHFAPKSHLQPGNNSWSCFGLFSWNWVSSFQWISLAICHAFVRQPPILLLLGAKRPGSDKRNYVLFGITWLLSSSNYYLWDESNSLRWWSILIYH